MNFKFLKQNVEDVYQYFHVNLKDAEFMRTLKN